MGSGGLTNDARLVIEAATASARSANHAEVTLLHVVDALIAQQSALLFDLLPLAFCRDELRLLVDAQLADLPRTGGYRDRERDREHDDDDVPFAPSLRALIERKRGFFFSRALSLSELVDLLFEDADCARLIASARMDLEPLDTTLDEARGLAHQYGHVETDIAHVLRVLVETRWLAAAMTAVNGDIDALRSSLDATLESFRRRTRQEPFTPITPNKVLASLLTKTRANRNPSTSTSPPLTSDALLSEILNDPSQAALFIAAQVRPLDLSVLLLHAPHTRIKTTTKPPRELL